MAERKIPVARHDRAGRVVRNHTRSVAVSASEQLAGDPPLRLLPQDPSLDDFPGQPLSSRRVEHPEPHAARMERLVEKLDPDLTQREHAMAVCTLELEYWLAQKVTRHRAHAGAVIAMARRELAAHEAEVLPATELTAHAWWGGDGGRRSLESCVPAAAILTELRP